MPQTDFTEEVSYILSSNSSNFPFALPPLGSLGTEIYNLMLELVAIPSVTGSDGEEDRCARFIYERLSRLEYFKHNEKDLKLLPLAGDPLGRHSLLALVRASRPTKKTIVLTGHFDVVDAEVCGPIRLWAFEPEEYTKRIAELSIPEEAREDLESGNYIFGRGVADMKTGIAVDIVLLEEYALQRERLDFNIMLLAVPDEEGDSTGMRGSVVSLVELQEEEGLDFLAMVNTEPVFESTTPAIYYGTIGKMMPLYLCVGRESHVGGYYEGLNSTLIASYLNISLDGAEDTIESYGGETFQPQCCLRMRDLRSRYAVTLPERTVVYYNCLTVEKTPAALLDEMKIKAKKALEKTLVHVGNVQWMPEVLTVEELLRKASEMKKCTKDDLVREFLECPRSVDERERNIEFLSWILDLTGEKGPLVLVGFVPPYYPPRNNGDRTVYERGVRNAAHSTKDFLKKRGYAFEEIEIFQGITDLSYTGFQGDMKDIVPLATNTPLWGYGYELPLRELHRIDIPSVLMGPIGKDAHKITERVDLEFSFNILPAAIKNFIESLVEYHNKS